MILPQFWQQFLPMMLTSLPPIHDSMCAKELRKETTLHTWPFVIYDTKNQINISLFHSS